MNSPFHRAKNLALSLPASNPRLKLAPRKRNPNWEHRIFSGKRAGWAGNPDVQSTYTQGQATRRNVYIATGNYDIYPKTTAINTHNHSHFMWKPLLLFILWPIYFRSGQQKSKSLNHIFHLLTIFTKKMPQSPHKPLLLKQEPLRKSKLDILLL